jgi:CRISPR-associated endonuclease/helicase Cas3
MMLSPDDFATFFEEAHGCKPFPWQHRLLRHVAGKGAWPNVLDLPTGTGKTAAIDIAVFHLALEAECKAARRAPARIAFVVDRRLVVDDAFARAEKLGVVLAAPQGPVTARVAEQLKKLSGDGPALIARRLRGGIPREDDWARTPSQPTVLCSTVDQIGSRLLFRGYGVTERMASVHAGLLGHDTLFLLDEVHLSVPFAETLLALRERWRHFWPNDLPDRWGVVRLSATPGMQRDTDRAFTLEPGGEDDHDARLAPRLHASKPASCKLVAVSGRDEDRKRSSFAARCAEAAAAFLKPEALAAPGAARTLGVIVNRVATAREVAANLKADVGEAADIRLRTGRMRP